MLHKARSLELSLVTVCRDIEVDLCRRNLCKTLRKIQKLETLTYISNSSKFREQQSYPMYLAKCITIQSKTCCYFNQIIWWCPIYPQT